MAFLFKPLYKSKLKSSYFRKTTKSISGGGLNKNTKYGNKPTGGFDSKAEKNRYVFLLSLQNQGRIKNLMFHVMFFFSDGSRYEADFVYYEDGKKIVEDVKHPLLLHGMKFINNRRKMLSHFNLDVAPIVPSKVWLPREKAKYKTTR